MEMGFFDFVVSSSGRGYRVLNEYDCYDHDEYTFNLCLRDNQRLKYFPLVEVKQNQLKSR